MTPRWVAVGAMLIGLVMTACAGAPPAPITDRTRPDRGPPPPTYSVRKGDTLYSIAWSYGLNYREVARWNRIGPPYRIYPGQVLHLRPVVARAAPRPAPQVAQAPSRPAPRPVPPSANPAPRPVPPGGADRKPRPAPGVEAQPTTAPPKSPPATNGRRALTWTWPADGRLVRTFAANGAKKGIAIAGKAGQPVRAAAAGEVVYSGDGVLRYGKLIIIKHDPVYFSAYAHNRKLLVREGQRVEKGQPIAEMGSTGTTETMLHFEVRRNGASVDPLIYLPRR